MGSTQSVLLLFGSKLYGHLRPAINENAVVRSVAVYRRAAHVVMQDATEAATAAKPASGFVTTATLSEAAALRYQRANTSAVCAC